jgi:hypothetical protein
LPHAELDEDVGGAIAKLTKLRRLDLTACGIDDATVDRLAALTEFSKVGLAETSVSDSAAVRLSAALDHQVCCRHPLFT